MVGLAYSIYALVFVGGGTPGSSNMVGLGLELHYIIILAVVGFLATTITLDLVCFCSRNCGIMACIYGSMDHENKKPDRTNMILFGAE